jgi:hypothetical protein
MAYICLMKSLVMVFLITLSVQVQAQDMLALFMPFRASDWRIELEGLAFHKTPVENSQQKITQQFESINITRRILETDKDTLFLSTRYQKLDFSERSQLLDDYYDMQLGLQWRRNIADNRFYSFTMGYGSSSNKPFESSDVTTINSNFIYQFNAKWFGILNYSNNRNFLNNIPLPSFLYLHTMSRNEVLVLGFPVIFWKTQMHEDFSFQLNMFGPFRISTRLTYTNSSLAPFFMLEQAPENFLKYQRISDEYQVFWIRRALVVGFGGMFYRGMGYEAQLGHAFDQRLQESEGLNGEKLSEVKFKDDQFIKLNLKMNF